MYKKHVKDELFYKPSYELSNKQTKSKLRKKNRKKVSREKKRKKEMKMKKNEYIIEKRYRNK